MSITMTGPCCCEFWFDEGNGVPTATTCCLVSFESLVTKYAFVFVGCEFCCANKFARLKLLDASKLVCLECLAVSWGAVFSVDMLNIGNEYNGGRDDLQIDVNTASLAIVKL